MRDSLLRDIYRSELKEIHSEISEKNGFENDLAFK